MKAASFSRGSLHTSSGAITLLALVVIACLATLTGCASSSQGGVRSMPANTPSSASGAPTPAPTPATTEGRLALAVRQAVGAAAQSVDLAYHQTTETIDVAITLAWEPAWKTHFAQAQAAAKQACYKAQAALWTSSVPLSGVSVTILGQALDDYGNVITSAYAAVTLTSAAAHAIQWSTTTADAAWSRYDVVFLRPLYGSDWMNPPGPTSGPQV